jgi:hypothetical protein
MPVPSEQTGHSCASCGAALASDQRYCLTCGQPASPVRLAFLDVLQSDGAAVSPPSQIAYTPLPEPVSGPTWLRRYSPLFSVAAVLLVALLIGLLVGHWASQGSSPGKQVVEVKGLSGLPAAAASAAPSTAPASAAASSAASKSNAKKEAEEAKAESKETRAEKAPPPKPVKVTQNKLQKLSSSTGKKHQEEINALGAQPIETGG